jgi:hypothetical protein
VNELVILAIHLAKEIEDVIEVLTIDILPSFSSLLHGHVQEIKTSALEKMADSNSVDLFVMFNSELKRVYGSKARERKNSEFKDRSLDVESALPLVAMLSRRGICIPPNGFTVLIWRARVIKDRCLKKVEQHEHTPR